MNLNIFNLITLGAGAFCLLGAIMDWEWFMSYRWARFISEIFGRAGARIFYAALGLVLIAAGVARIMGMI
jgi:hypothetical protein